MVHLHVSLNSLWSLGPFASNRGGKKHKETKQRREQPVPTAHTATNYKHVVF